MLKFGLLISFAFGVCMLIAQPKPPRFKVLALYENGGNHVKFSTAAKLWLDKLSADSGFVVDYIQSTDTINDSLLAAHQLFLQLDFPPYAWKEKAITAFESYITKGVGGWVGFHHATLLGEFDGYPLWNWFSAFMGDIKFKSYIPGFADGRVNIEDRTHPIVKGLPASFTIQKEEWYTYNHSPRANVHVIASVDESSYEPASDKKTGDHPVVWSNLNVAARNVYIFMGHGAQLLADENYKALVKNAIFWAASK